MRYVRIVLLRRASRWLPFLAVALLLAVLSGGPAQAGEPGMFQLYAENQAQGIPNYITADFILTAYSLALNEAVTELEEKELYPAMRQLVGGLHQKLQNLQDKDKAAQANLAYLGVLSALLEGTPGSGEVAEELRRIREAREIKKSPLLHQQVDYSQFKVRGKYSRNETLSRYFQARKYAGTVLFPVKASKATGVQPEEAELLTRQALALAGLIQSETRWSAAYKKLEERLTWLFGPADDLTLAAYVEVGREKGRPMAEVQSALLQWAKANSRQPKIISGMVEVTALEPGMTAADVMTGWRFLPAHYTPDSAVFQQMVFDKVTDYRGQGKPFSLAVINNRPVKGFPLGLELMALLGSAEADKRLQAAGERDYDGYDRAAVQAREILKSRSTTLPAEHLNLLRTWFKGKPAGPAEAADHLNAGLGFWTCQRYLNILYAKQSYTMVAKGLTLSPDRAVAWLEPATELYQGLAALTGKTGQLLQSPRLKELKPVLERCAKIARQENHRQALAKGDIAFLNNLDHQLLPLVGQKDHPLVVDLHTEPNSGLVLEEALGYPGVATRNVGNQECRGARFTYYEFKHPLSDRLDDAKWQQMFREGKVKGGLGLSPGSTLTAPAPEAKR